MAREGTGEALLPVLKNQMRSARTALWLRPAIFSVVAAVAAVLLATVEIVLPSGSLDWLPEVETAAVENLLEVLASGMLTVATVTLSVHMLVLNLAAGQVSPRAVPEIMADRVTQNAMGNFLGTFVYALSALLLLGFEVVARGGVSLLFLGALLMMLNAVRYLVQWIHHVAEILKINHTLHRVHRQAVAVLDAYLADDAPKPCTEVATPSGEALPLRPCITGYIELIDGERLHRLACDHDLAVRLLVQEGDFVHPHRVLMAIHGARPDAAVLDALRGAVVVGFERTHEGDPRFGFELLAEVASRALSPGINDPQSAIACVNYLGSLLAKAGSCPPGRYPAPQTADDRVRYLRADFAAMLERALRPIMRDGAGFAEVIDAILRVLRDLAGEVAPDYLASIVMEARRAEDLAEGGLQLAVDKKAIHAVAREVREAAGRRGVSAAR